MFLVLAISESIWPATHPWDIALFRQWIMFSFLLVYFNYHYIKCCWLLHTNKYPKLNCLFLFTICISTYNKQILINIFIRTFLILLNYTWCYIIVFCVISETGELKSGSRCKDRPHLRYMDVCKRDLKSTNINSDTWEAVAENRTVWKQQVSLELRNGEQHVNKTWKNKASQIKSSTLDEESHAALIPGAPVFACRICGRLCKSRIGLHSHFRRCFSSQP